MRSQKQDPGPIPLERELQERVAWFLHLRWMAGAGIFVGTWVATTFVMPGLSPLPLYVVGVGVLCYNALFAAFLHRFESRTISERVYGTFIRTQIAVDWVCLVFLMHYSGGIQSPVSLAFTFHLIIGAILLSRRACLIQAGAASLLLGSLALGEGAGLWSPVEVQLAARAPYLGPLAEFYWWLSLSGVFAVAAFLTTSITTRLREKERALFRSEQDLDRACQEMETLYELGQVVNATLDLDPVLGLIAENGAKLSGMKGCSVQLLDAPGKRLHIAGAYGLSQAYLDKGPLLVERSPIAAKVLSGEAVQVFDVSADPRWFQYPDEARREGISSVLSVPMSARGRTIGLVRVYSGGPHRFSEEEQNFLRNLGNLGAVAIESARAFTDLNALSEEKAWFARTTTHQLRSPLATIQGLLDALPYAGALSDKQQDLIQRCFRRIDDLLDLIRDLLDLTYAQRPTAGQQAEPVSLLECLSGVLEATQERARAKGVHLTIDGEQATVNAQPEDITRIFANLLDNAVKYTPSGGRVSFRVKVQNNEVRSEVADTGIGISGADQERVFGEFYRTEAAKATGELGTGLGLLIVRQLVERWNGTVALQSAPGEGSRFMVTLPAVRSDVSRST